MPGKMFWDSFHLCLEESFLLLPIQCNGIVLVLYVLKILSFVNAQVTARPPPHDVWWVKLDQEGNEVATSWTFFSKKKFAFKICSFYVMLIRKGLWEEVGPCISLLFNLPTQETTPARSDFNCFTTICKLAPFNRRNSLKLIKGCLKRRGRVSRSSLTPACAL